MLDNNPFEHELFWCRLCKLPISFSKSLFNKPVIQEIVAWILFWDLSIFKTLLPIEHCMTSIFWCVPRSYTAAESWVRQPNVSHYTKTFKNSYFQILLTISYQWHFYGSEFTSRQVAGASYRISPNKCSLHVERHPGECRRSRGIIQTFSNIFGHFWLIWPIFKRIISPESAGGKFIRSLAFIWQTYGIWVGKDQTHSNLALHTNIPGLANAILWGL